MKLIRFLVLLLMVVGALNWGLVGLFGIDVVAKIFGGMMTMGARVVYCLVGLAGLVGLCKLFCCGKCSGGGCGSGGCGNGGCKCGPGCGCCNKKQD